MLLIRLAWRNIWRNKVRSSVVIGAIALGIWAAVFMSAFATGMIKAYISNAVDNIVSHVQIHHRDFKKDYDTRLLIPETSAIEQQLGQIEAIEAWSMRGVANGMLSTPRATRGIQIKAVKDDEEGRVTSLDKKIVEGQYFKENKRNQLLIGDKLAERLKLKLRSKVVLTFQNLNQEITSGAFRIVGIFNTDNNTFDGNVVFINIDDYSRLIEWAEDRKDRPVHEIALMLSDANETPTVLSRLKEAQPDLLVESYKEISPDLDLYESQIRFVSIIYLVVIMLALIFGIINTMLMAVLERIRELGMLMAIGMNKGKVFFMVVLETWFLGLVAAPLGILFGYVTITVLGKKGINLSRFSAPLEEFGMAQIIYPEIREAVYFQVAVAITLTAILASIYPALKAIRLKPVEAIRKL